MILRSNKGSLLRRFHGNFGNAVSLAKIGKGNDDRCRLAVWDGSKREIVVYDILQGPML
jgi:hypothetical protein